MCHVMKYANHDNWPVIRELQSQPIVYDFAPTSEQHWFSIPCCSLKASHKHATNVGLMLAHCLRRWANIKPTLDHSALFDGL